MGEYQVTVQVSDSYKGSVSVEFNLTVIWELPELSTQGPIEHLAQHDYVYTIDESELWEFNEDKA